MCKLGVISCFTKTGCCWNFFCSIWMVWFVCSKLHSDFEAFFLVSWYSEGLSWLTAGVWFSFSVTEECNRVRVRTEEATCSCSWNAGCRGSRGESWSSSEASCRYLFRSGADEWPRALPPRALLCSTTAFTEVVRWSRGNSWEHGSSCLMGNCKTPWRFW